jgi:hypothetical protein
MMIVLLNIFLLKMVLGNYPLFQHMSYHYTDVHNYVSFTHFKIISLQNDVNLVKERSISPFEVLKVFIIPIITLIVPLLRLLLDHGLVR